MLLYCLLYIILLLVLSWHKLGVILLNLLSLYIFAFTGDGLFRKIVIQHDQNSWKNYHIFGEFSVYNMQTRFTVMVIIPTTCIRLFIL